MCLAFPLVVTSGCQSVFPLAGLGEERLALPLLDWQQNEDKFSMIVYTIGVNCISPVETQAMLC